MKKIRINLIILFFAYGMFFASCSRKSDLETSPSNSCSSGKKYNSASGTCIATTDTTASHETTSGSTYDSATDPYYNTITTTTTTLTIGSTGGLGTTTIPQQTVIPSGTTTNNPITDMAKQLMQMFQQQGSAQKSGASPSGGGASPSGTPKGSADATTEKTGNMSAKTSKVKPQTGDKNKDKNDPSKLSQSQENKEPPKKPDGSWDAKEKDGTPVNIKRNEDGTITKTYNHPSGPDDKRVVECDKNGKELTSTITQYDKDGKETNSSRTWKDGTNLENTENKRVYTDEQGRQHISEWDKDKNRTDYIVGKDGQEVPESRKTYDKDLNEVKPVDQKISDDPKVKDVPPTIVADNAKQCTGCEGKTTMALFLEGSDCFNNTQMQQELSEAQNTAVYPPPTETTQEPTTDQWNDMYTYPPSEVPTQTEQPSIPPYEVPSEQPSIPPYEVPSEKPSIPPYEVPPENYDPGGTSSGEG